MKVVVDTVTSFINKANSLMGDNSSKAKAELKAARIEAEKAINAYIDFCKRAIYAFQADKSNKSKEQIAFNKVIISSIKENIAAANKAKKEIRNAERLAQNGKKGTVLPRSPAENFNIQMIKGEPRDQISSQELEKVNKAISKIIAQAKTERIRALRMSGLLAEAGVPENDKIIKQLELKIHSCGTLIDSLTNNVCNNMVFGSGSIDIESVNNTINAANELVMNISDLYGTANSAENTLNDINQSKKETKLEQKEAGLTKKAVINRIGNAKASTEKNIKAHDVSNVKMANYYRDIYRTLMQLEREIEETNDLAKIKEISDRLNTFIDVSNNAMKHGNSELISSYSQEAMGIKVAPAIDDKIEIIDVDEPVDSTNDNSSDIDSDDNEFDNDIDSDDLDDNPDPSIMVENPHRDPVPDAQQQAQEELAQVIAPVESYNQLFIQDEHNTSAPAMMRASKKWGNEILLDVDDSGKTHSVYTFAQPAQNDDEGLNFIVSAALQSALNRFEPGQALPITGHYLPLLQRTYELAMMNMIPITAPKSPVEQHAFQQAKQGLQTHFNINEKNGIVTVAQKPGVNFNQLPAINHFVPIGRDTSTYSQPSANKVNEIVPDAAQNKKHVHFAENPVQVAKKQELQQQVQENQKNRGGIGSGLVASSVIRHKH